MILCVACACGSSDSLIRKKLRLSGYPDWLKIKVYQGKDKSLSALSTIQPYPEVALLKNYIESNSRYAVILGCNESKCRWSDVASANPKESIEAELIVRHFQ